MGEITAPESPVTELAQRVRQFVDERILPHESRLAAENDEARALARELSQQARAAGVFGSFYPMRLGGRIASLADYLHVAEQEGRSEYAPGILGADATLDAHMLDRHASPAVRERFLSPLVRGEAVSSYAMSEPESIGSIPATMTCRAELRDGRWHINGRKWFICRSQVANFATVVARSGEGPVAEAISMIVVPTDAPGFRVVRPLSLLGRWQGQAELAFDDLQAPQDHVLGAPGQGIALMQERLGLGRLLRSAHWLGQAQRCFELMCQRIHSPKGQLARLADKQLARARVYRVHRGIATARALVRDAAGKFDAGIANGIEVNLAKLAASDAVSEAADNAIQIMGAEGLSDWTALAGIYRGARTTHILDGADDALVSTIGRQLLMATRPGERFDPAYPSLRVSRAAE
ncbi:acyl-CoA dehydrogenase family protein [Stutzerimonas kirkiae]|uniref:acyl-CoA dehydrogenase family protein n=1 Tax=Stutzerimonas kirkiae TaxID=2211392 RepID=UPI001038590E|nr:acyl-CoA dehydrogenase family protein [Stutzerimonas kirkiae]TBV08378.1 acyl-CoA dehydrogenase [Stutzerimonas kirkiae]